MHGVSRLVGSSGLLDTPGHGGWVDAMVWAVSLRRDIKITDAMVEQRYVRFQEHGDVNARESVMPQKHQTLPRHLGR